MQNTGIQKNKKAELISWVILLLLAIVFYFAATDYFVFPVKLKYPLLLGLIVLVCIAGIISILVKKKGKIFACVLNCLFIICMIIGLFFLPYLESKVKSIFADQSKATSVVNVYALKDDGRERIEDYSDALFVVQRKTDIENQNNAIEEIQNILDIKKIKTSYQEDIVSAAKTLYEKQGDLLILNEVYVDLLEEIEGFENFSEDTKIIYTITREIESEAEPLIPIRTDITDTPFTVYVAGCDTRSGRLTTYGRTDVNLILNVNPNIKQILIVGIPRDSYVLNPALDYGNDKLTHLGNNGIYNTMKGVSEYFNIEINYYGEVIFDTFKNIIDAVGGIDVDNPYYFTEAGQSFPEGTIHLNGTQALAYARTRYALSNGDYGRNEHQTFVLKAFIKKIMSPSILSSYNELFDALKGQFMTDMSVEDLFKLANMQLNDGGDWVIVTYHLGGNGDMCGTASMGWDRKLYVVHLFDSQVKFVKNQIDLLKKDMKIKQETLPQDGDTTFIPN